MRLPALVVGVRDDLKELSVAFDIRYVPLDELLPVRAIADANFHILWSFLALGRILPSWRVDRDAAVAVGLLSAIHGGSRGADLGRR